MTRHISVEPPHFCRAATCAMRVRLGNEVAIAKAKKPPTKAELKKIKKAIAEKRKGGLEVYTDEELEEAGFLVEG